jgi:Leucine-rich repeat (LRR) protein
MFFSKLSLLGALSLLSDVDARRLATKSSKTTPVPAPAPAEEPFADQVCTDFCDDYFARCSNYNIYMNPTSASSDSMMHSITTKEDDLERKKTGLAEAYSMCLETCMQFPRPINPAKFDDNWTEGANIFRSNLGGDTFWCRERHLSLAVSPNSEAFHCPHAGNPSNGICRDALVDGFTPYEHLRDGADTKHRLPYCDVAGNGKVADCQAGGIDSTNLSSALSILPDTVEILFLSGNDLGSIGGSAFMSLKNYRNLKALYLNDCKVTSIAANALSGLGNLEIFNADENLVETLHEDFLKFTPKLTQFSMFHNYDLFKSNGNKMPVKFFSHTPHLEVISLYGTAITTFDAGTFKGLRKVKMFSWVTNMDITENSFPAGLFDDLVSVQFFDFFANKITTIPENFFGPWANNILRLAFWNNPISSIHPNAGLEHLKSIETAYFDFRSADVGNAVGPATFDIAPVAKKLMDINPMVTITYGSTE